MGRLSPGSMANPPSSCSVMDRPTPNSRRPRLMMSRTAAASAERAGWLNGGGSSRTPSRWGGGDLAPQAGVGLGRESPVDDDGLTGDEGRLVAGQPQGRVGDVGRLAGPGYGLGHGHELAQHVGVDGLVPHGVVVEDGGDHAAGTDAVD